MLTSLLQQPETVLCHPAWLSVQPGLPYDTDKEYAQHVNQISIINKQLFR